MSSMRETYVIPREAFWEIMPCIRVQMREAS